MWSLKSKEHVVLVHKTDRDAEIHPEEPLEPADYKKGDEAPCTEVLGFDSSRTKQSATYFVFLNVKVTLFKSSLLEEEYHS